MLRPVARTHCDLAPQHERHRAPTAEHVPGLADLVEQLIRRDPHKICVHEFHDGPVTAVDRNAPTEAGEGVLADWRPEHSVGISLLETASSAIGPAFEAVNILTHDDDAWVGRQLATHDA